MEAKEFDKSRLCVAVLEIYNPLEPLLPYQKKWVADKSTIKLADKSRRTGLTFGEACDDVLDANKTNNPTNTYYIGADKEMAKEFIDACAFWAKHFNKICSDISESQFVDTDDNGKETTINTFEIKFKNTGKKIVALSSNPRNLRGRQGNVVIDEAAFHERLDEVLKAAVALTMWGGKLRIISTHNGTDNLFNTTIQDAYAGKNDYSVHYIPLDQAVAQGLYKRICQMTGQEWSQENQDAWMLRQVRAYPTEEAANEELFCVPSKGAGAYLSRALIVNRQNMETPLFRLEQSADFNEWPVNLRTEEIQDWLTKKVLPCLKKLDRDKRHFVGQDFARSGDFSVITIGEEQQNGDIHVVLTVEMRNMPHAQQKQILFYLLKRLPRFSGCQMDAGGNGEELAEAAVDKFGSSLIKAVKITENWYRENMPAMKTALEDGNLEIQKDVDHRDDLRALRINNRGVPCLPKTKTDFAGKRHGDFAVALCMLVAASKMEGGEIDWESISDKKDRWDQSDNDDNDYGYEMTGTY